MRKMLMFGVVGMLLFAGSAAGSWFLMESQKQNEEAADSESAEGDTVATSDAGERPDGRPQLAANTTQATLPMPVGLRSEKPITIEAVLRLSQSIKEKEQLLNEREKMVLKDEQRVKLMFEDIKREQDELLSFGESIDTKIIEAREALELLQQEQRKLDEQRKALAQLQKSTGHTAADAQDAEILQRVNNVKDWFNGLQDEQAASYLREFANRGDLEFAARLLDSQEDRTKAKILNALNDATLVAQFIEALTQPSTSTDKRGQQE